jgi:hypothetical protein
MPLAFESVSHGTVAFGFFNIESDMLLLERYFFFASDFCRYISDIAESHRGEYFEHIWNVYFIENPQAAGDLMGAIHGVRYTGFIGEVYRRFPFPKNADDFKQKAYGFENRAVTEEIIRAYSQPAEISFVADESQLVRIGEYHFSLTGFQSLIQYVWRGGYPRWKDEARPDYVIRMKNKIGKSNSPLFRELMLN